MKLSVICLLLVLLGLLASFHSAVEVDVDVVISEKVDQNSNQQLSFLPPNSFNPIPASSELNSSAEDEEDEEEELEVEDEDELVGEEAEVDAAKASKKPKKSKKKTNAACTRLRGQCVS